MATLFWVGGTGSYDGVTNHFATTSGGAASVALPTSADSVTFDGSSGGGTVTFTTTLTCSSFTGGAFTGTVDTNGQTCTITNTFSISGSGTRTYTLGATTVSCNSWDASTATNLTFNCNTSTISITGSTTFFGGGLTYNTVTMLAAFSGEGITGANTFANFTKTGSTQKVDSLTLSADQVITNTLTINGNSAINRFLVKSSTIGTNRTLTAANVVVTYADFQDITGAGAGSWNLSAITGNSGDCGGNTGITFTTPATQTATGTASFTWSTHGWTSRVPLPQDNVVINNAFVAGRTVTADMPRLCKSVTFSCSGSPIFALTADTSIYGSLDLTGAVSMTGTFTINFNGRSSLNLNTAGVTITGSIIIEMPGGGLTLQSDLTCNLTITLNPATFDAANFNITVSSFVSSGTPRVITMGSGTWNLTGNTANIWLISTSGQTLNPNTSTLKFTGVLTANRTLSLGGATYYNFWNNTTGAFALIVSGSNTFNDFKIDAGRSQNFTAATTQTVNTFTAVGTAASQITINSTTTGIHTLTHAVAGSIYCNNLNIQHSVVTSPKGGNWYAGINSVDNNSVATAGSGWIFGDNGGLKNTFSKALRPRIFAPGGAR